MTILVNQGSMAGLNRAVAQMKDQYRERFMRELNELIITHMIRYGANDEVKWFEMVERPPLRYEDASS